VIKGTVSNNGGGSFVVGVQLGIPHGWFNSCMVL